MQKIFLYFLLLMILPVFRSAAQQDDQLERQLQNKDNLTDVMNIVEAYYKNPATIAQLGSNTIKSKLKRWKRWEWFISSRLGPGGKFVNYSRLLTEALSKQNSVAANGSNAPVSFAGSWASIGPTSSTGGLGRADRIAFHPTDPDIIFAGTPCGGLWKTSNGGISWTNLTDQLPSLGISGISVHPLTPNIIHILTGDGDSGGDFSGLVDIFGYGRQSIGVLQTTDGGQTWLKVGNFTDTITNLTGFALHRDPDNANILLAATSHGLFRTTNSGSSWTKVLNDKCVDVLFKPTGTTCYAITRLSGEEVQFHISINSGLNWNLPTGSITGLNNAGRSKLAVTPQNSSIVYFLCGNAIDSGQFAGLLRSTQSGNNIGFQSFFPNIMGKISSGADDYDHSGYNLSMAIRPNTTSTIVTGAVYIWRSTNSGIPDSWTYLGGTHADIHDLQYNPLDNKLWAATDAGVYYSTNNGDDWTVAYNGMPVSQVYRMDVKPSNYLQILAGLQDIGFKYKSTGSFSYTHLRNADGFGVGFDALHDSIFYGTENDNVLRFTDNGNDIESIRLDAPQMDDFYFNLAVHTSLGNSLFVGSDTVWRTTNAGTSWSASAIEGGWHLRTCPSNGNRIYAAGGSSYDDETGILRRSDNAGSTWISNNILSNKPGFPLSYPKITSINVRPTNSAQVWVTFGGFTNNVKVYYSDSLGTSWVNMSGTLPNIPINCIVLDDNNNAYIGTDIGVYYRADNMNDWVPFGNNLPYVPVTDLIISQAEGRIRASTFGRGIWSSDLYSGCSQTDIVLGGVLDGRAFYEASNSVTSTSTLLQSVGTKIQMRGGNEVTLLSGFSASEQTQFHALTGPCGSGGVASFRMAGDTAQTVVEPSPATSLKRKALLHVKPGAGNPEIIITALEAGEYQLLITRKDGQQVKQQDLGYITAGITEKALLPGALKLTHGLYYVHLYQNGVRQHFQEWEVR